MILPAFGTTIGIPGVVTVGYASVAGDTGGEGAAAKANASAVLFGVTLTLLGQVVQAAQAGWAGNKILVMCLK
jgi:hypothetical protein